MACCCTGAKARDDGDSNWELLPFDGETSTRGVVADWGPGFAMAVIALRRFCRSGFSREPCSTVSRRARKLAAEAAPAVGRVAEGTEERSGSLMARAETTRSERHPRIARRAANAIGRPNRKVCESRSRMVPSGLKLTGNGNADSGNTTAASPGTPRLRTARRTRAAAAPALVRETRRTRKGRPSIRHRKMRGQSQRRGWYAAIECGLAEPAAGHRLQQFGRCHAVVRSEGNGEEDVERAGDAAADEHGAELASILHGSSAGLGQPASYADRAGRHRHSQVLPERLQPRASDATGNIGKRRGRGSTGSP